MSQPAPRAVERVLAGSGLLDGIAAVAVASPATGWASWAAGVLPGGTLVTPRTPMYAASLSKQVIAALAAELVLSGRLDPDTRIRLLLPDLPAWAGAIRVRHLVHHTSGLPSTDRVMTAAGVAGAAQLDNALVLNGLHGLADPDRPAGTAFVYSNVGYVVLAEVVGVVAGEAIGGFAHRMLFSPLGLTGSHLGGAADVVLPGLPAPPRTVGDGGWWTTAQDLLAWLDCLNAGRLGHELTRLIQTPGALDDGTPLEYAWGMTARPGPAGTFYTHGGQWPGWTAKTVRSPAAGTAVGLLTTNDDATLVSEVALAMHEGLTRSR